MRVVSVVGARPQFVKLAPIDRELRGRGIQHIIVHSGQHYDELLSDVFFADLGIPAPDVHISPHSGSPGEQVGNMISRLDGILREATPDWVLVYGDTNTTLAGAIASAKAGLPLAHLEAGLRSHNWSMPEELNRVLTDRASQLLLVPTRAAKDQLEREGITDGVVVTGDVMVDVLVDTLRRSPAPNPLAESLGEGNYFLATIHRAENTDNPDRLERVLRSLSEINSPVVLLTHPRLAHRAESHGISLMQTNVLPRPPLPYPQLLSAIRQSRGIITDSGGLQKEAFLLRIPCTTVRAETEWPETLLHGWNVLAEPGTSLRETALRPLPPKTDAAPYGDGRAARAVVDALVEHGPRS